MSQATTRPKCLECRRVCRAWRACRTSLHFEEVWQAQMDGLAFSVGGYAVSAAYSTVASTVVYLPRIRKNSKQPDCAFEDFRHQCVHDPSLSMCQ